MNNIKLSNLNKEECARYLGYKGNSPDERVKNIMDDCEMDIINTAIPRYLYRQFPIEFKANGVEVLGTSLLLTGNSIRNHLEGCSKVFILAATLSGEMDRLIARTQINDMAKAVILDAMAGVAIEQVCDKAEVQMKKEIEGKYFTYRFGIGYGDLPIFLEHEILDVLNASKLIGLCSNESYILTPRKSVLCIIGISDKEIKSMRRGCSTCKLSNRCEFRKRGDRCGF
ncbi:MAG: methionine synthase [Clostridiales bacterium]|nr:methionine synthase [Clostridiales bacterium]